MNKGLNSIRMIFKGNTQLKKFISFCIAQMITGHNLMRLNNSKSTIKYVGAGLAPNLL